MGAVPRAEWFDGEYNFGKQTEHKTAQCATFDAYMAEWWCQGFAHEKGKSFGKNTGPKNQRFSQQKNDKNSFGLDSGYPPDRCLEGLRATVHQVQPRAGRAEHPPCAHARHASSPAASGKS